MGITKDTKGKPAAILNVTSAVQIPSNQVLRMKSTNFSVRLENPVEDCPGGLKCILNKQCTAQYQRSSACF